MKIALALIVVLASISGYLLFLTGGIWGVVAGATVLGAIVSILYGMEQRDLR